MESKLQLQDTFLNEARRQKIPVTVYMTNGFQQRGTVVAFDGYTILLVFESKQYFVYKHAVSTIVPLKPVAMPQD